MSHTPVFLKEVIETLDPKFGEFFIDGTVGGGGHAVEIFKKISPGGRLLGIDWDEDNIKKLIEVKKLRNRKNIILVNDNYANLPEILKKEKLPKADGLLLDLGFSSEQLEKSGKGFSFLRDEPLNMRYNVEINNNGQATRDKRQETGITAAEVINSFSEKELADIFWKYGEERFSRRIAKNIVAVRKKKPIKTTFDLVEIIRKSLPRYYERGRIHPATRVFQALRIYVNDELGNLEKLLEHLDKIVKNKGRAVIISFHSLEDRLVKNYFRQFTKEGIAKILTKKPIRPTPEEVVLNPRSRSAKLRALSM